MSETQHDYAHGLARCSCGRIGLNHWPWEPSTGRGGETRAAETADGGLHDR